MFSMTTCVEPVTVKYPSPAIVTGTLISIRSSKRRSRRTGTLSAFTLTLAPGRRVVAASTAAAIVSRTNAAEAGLPVIRIAIWSARVPAAYATRTGTSRVTPRESVSVIVVVPSFTPVTKRTRCSWSTTAVATVGSATTTVTVPRTLLTRADAVLPGSTPTSGGSTIIGGGVGANK
jgi:hypothetical protein